MSSSLESTKALLLDLENGFWGAAGGDGSFYQANFAETGLMILPFEGGVLDKLQTISAVKQAGAWATYEIINPRLVEISSSDKALVYEAVGARPGQPDYHAYICSVYRLLNDKWELVIHQQTPFSK